MSDENGTVISPFAKDVSNMKEYRQGISDRTTPDKYVKQRPDGMDYVEEGYMRTQLDKLYPIWSWMPAGDNPIHFLGSEWVISMGTLIIEEPTGHVRQFFSPGASRIQFKRGKEHTPENVIDIDKNVATANTNGFKRATNRLCRIADDVYRKQDVDLSEKEINELRSLMELNEFEQNKIDEWTVKMKRGAITRLNIDEFKHWITTHNKEKSDA